MRQNKGPKKKIFAFEYLNTEAFFVMSWCHFRGDGFFLEKKVVSKTPLEICPCQSFHLS